LTNRTTTTRTRRLQIVGTTATAGLVLTMGAMFTGGTASATPLGAVDSKTTNAVSVESPSTLVVAEDGTATTVPSATLPDQIISSDFSASAKYPRAAYGSAVGLVSTTKRFDVTVQGKTTSLRRTDLSKVSAIQYKKDHGLFQQWRTATAVEMRLYQNGKYKVGTGVRSVPAGSSEIQWNPPGVYNDYTGKGIEVLTSYRIGGKWYKITAPVS
jgi:hypothetical protein